MKTALVLLLWMMFGVANAEVFRWTDAQGRVHFGDRPRPGAVKVDVPEVQTFKEPKINSVNNPVKAITNNDDDKKSRGYDSIKLVQPIQDSTHRDAQGMVPVIVSTSPDLKDGDQFKLIYDGASLGEPQSSPSFVLNNVLRGSHTVYVEVIDANGKEVGKSDTVTFFMHRPRVGMGGGV